MSYRLTVRRLAEADLTEAQDWYEEQRCGLGSEFRAAVSEMLARLTENPRLYQEIHRGVRRAVMSRFPYVLYFSVGREVVTILACLHGKRGPHLLRSRLR